MLAELAAAVRERRVSAVELVTESISRIERLDPPVNAVTAVWAEDALAVARALDERGTDGALAGLPLLVKDNTDVEGRVTNFGSRTMLDRPPAERSEITVERMVAAGAVIVGRTNIPEFAFQGYTDNDVFGPTCNPWGLEWSTGGSSGGSGAAIAAGLAPLATGTDGGGSVRSPAAFCGLVGLKPTAGLLGRRPIPSWLDFSTQGPLATSIEDCRLLLEVMRGPVSGDPTAAPAWTPRGGMPSRVFATPRTRDFGPLPADVEAPYRAALDAIERDLGLPVEEIPLRRLFPGAAVEGPATRDDWYLTVAVEELHWLGPDWVAAHMDEFSRSFREVMEDAAGFSLADYMAARLRRFDRVADVDALLEPDAVIVCPAHGYAGWRPDGTLPGLDRPAFGEGYNQGEFNMSGHPSLSVPAGLAENGIPFGLLVTGPRWRDDLVLEFGAAWERAHPWPVSAPGYEPFDAVLA
ncbi:MAG TPA: amidase [Actinomycetota bacterium]|jgi:amidase/aspartyl-tRNA(Asn)/glutamyl-tRNA(Gln) amidotransferase subunit A